MPRIRKALVSWPTFWLRSASEKRATASRSARCSLTSRRMSAASALDRAEVAAPRALRSERLRLTGRTNQLLPPAEKDPRLPPVSRCRTAYFQYAVWTMSSQMLCRPAAGRAQAVGTASPRNEPDKVVPCHDR